MVFGRPRLALRLGPLAHLVARVSRPRHRSVLALMLLVLMCITVPLHHVLQPAGSTFNPGGCRTGHSRWQSCRDHADQHWMRSQEDPELTDGNRAAEHQLIATDQPGGRRDSKSLRALKNHRQFNKTESSQLPVASSTSASSLLLPSSATASQLWSSSSASKIQEETDATVKGIENVAAKSIGDVNVNSDVYESIELGKAMDAEQNIAKIPETRSSTKTFLLRSNAEDALNTSLRNSEESLDSIKYDDDSTMTTLVQQLGGDTNISERISKDARQYSGSQDYVLVYSMCSEIALGLCQRLAKSGVSVILVGESNCARSDSTTKGANNNLHNKDPMLSGNGAMRSPPFRALSASKFTESQNRQDNIKPNSRINSLFAVSQTNNKTNRSIDLESLSYNTNSKNYIQYLINSQASDDKRYIESRSNPISEHLRELDSSFIDDIKSALLSISHRRYRVSEVHVMMASDLFNHHENDDYWPHSSGSLLRRYISFIDTLCKSNISIIINFYFHSPPNLAKEKPVASNNSNGYSERIKSDVLPISAGPISGSASNAVRPVDKAMNANITISIKYSSSLNFNSFEKNYKKVKPNNNWQRSLNASFTGNKETKAGSDQAEIEDLYSVHKLNYSSVNESQRPTGGTSKISSRTVTTLLGRFRRAEILLQRISSPSDTLVHSLYLMTTAYKHLYHLPLEVVV